MAEEGPNALLQSPEVPITSLGPDTSIRAPFGDECDNTSLKIIKDCMRESAHFGYGRTRSSSNSSFLGGANY
jgi:hypothetical protein